MSGELETVTIGGIELRFRDGLLERRFAGLKDWHNALYTSVAPDEADVYAEFCRRNNYGRLASVSPSENRNDG